MERSPRYLFSGIALLVCSGLASALALITLASNRLPNISATSVSALLLAIQWQLVGLTIVKFGIDYAIFTIVSRNSSVTFDARPALSRLVVPAAVAFSAFCVPMFGWMGALSIGIAVSADALSTFRQAEFNARRLYQISAGGALLNYPLFVALLAAMAGYIPLDVTIGLVTFATTSVLRLGWFSYWFGIHSRGTERIELSARSGFAAQGMLNVLLFRSDQIALAAMLFLLDAPIDPIILGAYVFLARFPEIANGVVVLLGTVMFPKFFINRSPELGRRRELWRVYGSLAAVVGCGGFAVISLSRPIYNGADYSHWFAIAFAAQIPLTLLVNLVMYSMQAQGYLPGLLVKLSLACGAGLTLLLLFLSTRLFDLLPWVIPIQLMTFLALFAFGSWGAPIKLYRPSGTR